MFRDRTNLLVVLMAISMVLIGMLLLGASAYLFVSDDENGEVVQAADQVGTACTFTGTWDGLVVYTAPLTDTTRVLDTIREDVAYPVQERRADHVLIEFDASKTGWVDRADGVLDGACDRVPLNTTPLAELDTTCVVSVVEGHTFYEDAALQTEAGTLPAGDYAGLRFTGSAYRLSLDGAYGRWIAAENVAVVRGDCARLPAD